MINPTEISLINFLKFIFRKKENLIILISALVLQTLLWQSFKILYPNANIIFDSYHYLNATISNKAVNSWPIGYSLFVRYLGRISHSINLVITTQYWLLNLSLLTFYFSIRYLYLLKLRNSIILIAFFIFNPIFIYTCNLILSDAIFVALSILWLTNLVWIIAWPHKWLLISHVLLLLTAFTIRYNALYFPIVSTIIFSSIRQSITFKIFGISIQYIAVIIFIVFTINEMDLTYGVRSFSPFGGWKLANNSLYMYKHVYKRDKSLAPQKFEQLHTEVKNYFDSNEDSIDLYTPDLTSGSYYMYIYPSPLITYRNLVFGNDYSSLNPTTFAKMGSLYQDYGTWLITKHPISFLKYFIIPNIHRYFISPTEVYTDNYNPFTIRMDSLGISTRRWFGINSISTKYRYISLRNNIFIFYPIINTIVHIFFIFIFIYFLFITDMKNLKPHNLLSIFCIGILWLCDFGFNVIASAVVLRYQIFIDIIEFSFSMIILNTIFNMGDLYKRKGQTNI